MARGQLFRLIRWLFETGVVKKGDTLLDPFGGVSTTAIAGASAGLKVITCELEPKFHALALENMEIHRRVWDAAGDPQPTCLLGDSRRLAEVAGPVLAQCCVSSPPYTGDALGCGGGPGAYGPGNAAFKKNGGYKQDGNNSGSSGHSYGSSPGNLGNLPPGDALASGVVSSPPWENQEPSHAQGDPRKFGTGGQTYKDAEYGSSEGQVGNTSGETFWSAAKQIVAQCHLLLRDGATTAWVCKSYVKSGKIVPFPDQWAALLEATGFRVTHRIRCHLVSETREADLFGGETVKRTERKSFFRRLHEKRSPHTRIDFEEIVVAVKVGEGGSAGAVVSSPPYSSEIGMQEKSPTIGTDPRPGDVRQYKRKAPIREYGHTAGQLGGMPPGEAPAPRRCNQCGKGDDGCRCCVPEE